MAVDESVKVTRRNFVGMLGALGLGATSMTMYNIVADDMGSNTPSEPVGAAPGTSTEHGSTPGAQEGTPSTDTGTSGELTVDEMDAMHEEGVKAFPAKTEGLGGQPLEYEMDGDVKVFKLTTSLVDWEYAPGQRTEAWCYNGATPGPEIRVTEGDTVRVEVTNELLESTSIHWHGLFVPNNQDGVPFMTQLPIKPGETFTYEFQIREGNTGSHMYHSHYNAAEQVTKGLLGAFIVDPKDPKKYGEFDKEYTLVLNDGPIGGFSINGKSFPATQPLTAKLGEKILVRYMNEGLMIHPMHLHGMPQLVVAQDGWLVPQPYMCDTLNIAPGQRFDVIVECNESGVWAFHCHILSHAESKNGMFGMVTALIVEE